MFTFISAFDVTAIVSSLIVKYLLELTFISRPPVIFLYLSEVRKTSASDFPSLRECIIRCVHHLLLLHVFQELHDRSGYSVTSVPIQEDARLVLLLQALNMTNLVKESRLFM